MPLGDSAPPVHPEPVEGRTEHPAPITDEDLRSWLLEELGLAEYRRVVRETGTTIAVSKFEPGFSQDLFAVVDLLPELFDDAAVKAEYEALSRRHLERGKAPMRTAVWREAGEAILSRIGEARGIDQRQRMLVLPGIESVQAVLDTILWSAPTIADARGPHPGELSEYEAFAAEARQGEPPPSGRDLFTRYYGSLDGRRVESYCPGAQFARRLVAQAWRICAGEAQDPPSPGLM